MVVIRSEPRDRIIRTRAAQGIQLESLFDESGGRVTILIVLVLFLRPLDVKFRRPSVQQLGLRRLRFRKLGLRPFRLLQLIPRVGFIADPELAVRWFVWRKTIDLWRAALGANVLALAASSIVSELVSNGTDQGGFAGGNEGFGAGGFGPGLGFEAAPVWPACGPVVSFGRPGWAWSRYCGPYSTYPLGWSGSG
jgi:hypothetical protein